MIELHTHTLLSDGDLLPSELVRRYEDKGYTAVALTDHVDSSNIDFIIPRIVKACTVLNKHWKIRSIPGVELTHVPLQEIPGLVRFARDAGAIVIVGHGETISEPVLPGTNRAFIKARVSVLAHPGMISANDVKLAAKNNIALEVTARTSHAKPNRHVITLARKYGAPMVLDTDCHSPENIMTPHERTAFLLNLGLKRKEIETIYKNAVNRIKVQ